MTLDCPSCGAYRFCQGNNEALVCLNTKCELYGQPQPDIDAGQLVVGSNYPGTWEEDRDPDEGGEL